jgi:transposase
VPLYCARAGDVQPVPAVAQDRTGAACRCCPGQVSWSTRRRCFPSDMTRAEWVVCEPLLPASAWLAVRGGRPARHCMRDIVDAIRYLTHNGPVWRALPADFPPAGTVYYWAAKWQDDGSTTRMNGDLRERVCAAAGRHQQPRRSSPRTPAARRLGGGHRQEVPRNLRRPRCETARLGRRRPGRAGDRGRPHGACEGLRRRLRRARPGDLRPAPVRAALGHHLVARVEVARVGPLFSHPLTASSCMRSWSPRAMASTSSSTVQGSRHAVPGLGRRAARRGCARGLGTQAGRGSARGSGPGAW